MTIIKPKIAIFDWDNTLVASWHKLHATINHVAAELGIELWSLEQVQHTMHKSSRDFFPSTFGENWERAKEIFYEKYKKDFADQVDPLEGAEETLRMLQDNGTKVCLLSNKSGPILRNEVSQIGWNKYCDIILGAYDLEEDKPSVMPVNKILYDLQGVSGKHNWFIGDTIVDMECGHNSGCHPILFGPQHEDSPHPDDHEIPHHHVLNHKELQDLYLSQKLAA